MLDDQACFTTQVLFTAIQSDQANLLASGNVDKEERLSTTAEIKPNNQSISIDYGS
jgi:hypothetical protein